jgi:hypothetical protein
LVPITPHPLRFGSYQVRAFWDLTDLGKPLPALREWSLMMSMLSSDSSVSTQAELSDSQQALLARMVRSTLLMLGNDDNGATFAVGAACR